MELTWWNKLTYEDAIQLFESGENKVAIVNATGTGKSSIISKVIEYFDKQDGGAKKLILVPLQSIADQFINDYQLNDNVEVLTYAKLSIDLFSEDEDIINSYKEKYSLIVADEMHRTGALKWGAAFQYLHKLNPSAKLLGATATPKRSDNEEDEDMVTELFDGNNVGNITLVDAVNADILPSFNYNIGMYSLTEEIRNKENEILASKTIDDKGKKSLKEFMRDKLIDWENSFGIDKSIKSSFDKKIKEKSAFGDSSENSLKIVVFCQNISHLQSIMPEIYEGFKKSFPSYEVKTFEYHSETDVEEYELFKEKSTPKSINLLFVVNSLNEGVHIEGIDGGVMLRYTNSKIVYLQQLGRMLSFSQSGENPVILDLVNNIISVGYLEDYINENDNNYFVNDDGQDKRPQGWDEWRERKAAAAKEKGGIIFNNMAFEAISYLESIEEKAREYSNAFYPYDGKQLSLNEIAQMVGMSKDVVKSFLNKGMTVEQIVNISKAEKKDNHLVNGIHYSNREFSKEFKYPLMAVGVWLSQGKTLQQLYDKINEE